MNCVPSWLIAVATVLSGPPDAYPALESQTFEKLAGVDLSAIQKTKIHGLILGFGPRIAAMESQAAPTQSQREERAKAIRRAAAEGKRGADAKRILATAGVPTAEQESAARQLARLHDELDGAVRAILSDAQRARLERPPAPVGDEATAWSGFIVVRLSASLFPVLKDSVTLEDVARKSGLRSLEALLTEFKLTKTSRAIHAIPDNLPVSPGQQREIQALIRRLESYWRIDVRGREDPLDVIVKRLNELPFVEVAYRELATSEPAGAGSIGRGPNPFGGRQGYLNPAPEGIDARHAWTQPNGQGARVGIVDVERSWNLRHEDFAAKSPALVHGDIRPGSDHGTGVLGEVVADDNDVGVVGAAPSAAYAYVSSWHSSDGTPNYVGKAIICALPVMNPGDVLLLEVERSPGIPTEVDEFDFDSIRLAVACGVIVVEAAGNRGRNLDLHRDPLGRYIFNRASPDCRDSGAIMVGAADPRNSNNRSSFSCYGSRIDCFGWGGFVTSCGFGDLNPGQGDPNKKYTRGFNGTSSAAPIVAGAAMILQGMAMGNSGLRIPPRLMRTLLSDPRSGTPQGPAVAGAIGVMPDLKSIIEGNASLLLGHPATACPPVDARGITSRPQQFARARGAPMSSSRRPLLRCFRRFRK